MAAGSNNGPDPAPGSTPRLTMPSASRMSNASTIFPTLPSNNTFTAPSAGAQSVFSPRSSPRGTVRHRSNSRWSSFRDWSNSRMSGNSWPRAENRPPRFARSETGGSPSPDVQEQSFRPQWQQTGPRNEEELRQSLSGLDHLWTSDHEHGSVNGSDAS